PRADTLLAQAAPREASARPLVTALSTSWKPQQIHFPMRPNEVYTASRREPSWPVTAAESVTPNISPMPNATSGITVRAPTALKIPPMARTHLPFPLLAPVPAPATNAVSAELTPPTAPLPVT